MQHVTVGTRCDIANERHTSCLLWLCVTTTLALTQEREIAVVMHDAELSIRSTAQHFGYRYFLLVDRWTHDLLTFRFAPSVCHLNP